jgi:hypothetical protein
MDLATSKTEAFMSQQNIENNSLFAEGLSCLFYESAEY